MSDSLSKEIKLKKAGHVKTGLKFNMVTLWVFYYIMLIASVDCFLIISHPNVIYCYLEYNDIGYRLQWTFSEHRWQHELKLNMVTLC